jgi:hypothetical protein
LPPVTRGSCFCIAALRSRATNREHSHAEMTSFTR